MDLVCILLLIPLTTATRRLDGPSYRSNVMEGDKPILRLGPERDDAETDNNSDEDRQPSPATERKSPESTKDLNQIVNWLVDHFSYDLVAIMGRKSNDGLLNEPPNESDYEEPNSGTEADPDDGIGIQQRKTPDSKSSVDPPVKPPSTKKTGLRSHVKKHKEEKVDPDWITDLKGFIKDLTTQYGQHEVLEKTKPVIASLEKKHHMKIKDIDVDEYGEIHITYIEKGKSKKTARKRKDTDF